MKIEFEKIKKTFVSKFNFFWISIFVPGFIVGLITAFQIDLDKMNEGNEESPKWMI